jgi:hypothetical protein
MATQAVLRKRLLMAIYRRSGGDPDKPINCADMASDLNVPLNEAILVTRQLEGKGYVQFTTKSLDEGRTNWIFVMKMQGIEEAEKMERGIGQRFYEDHVVIWSVVLLMLGFCLNALSGYIAQKPTIINIPEQKPPVVNVIMPEQKLPPASPETK